MTSDQRRLREALGALSNQQLNQVQEAVIQAENRNPVESPVRLDKFMASAGGSAARYREVMGCYGGVVSYLESPRPFATDGKRGTMSLAKWQQWARKAQLQHQASVEMRIQGVEGYWLHWEIQSALQSMPQISIGEE